MIKIFSCVLMMGMCLHSSFTEAKEMKKAPIDTVFEQGESNPYGQYFTGQTYLTMLNGRDDVFNAPIGNVTFEPGARTNWHKHSGGQILLVLNGEGRYQEKRKGYSGVAQRRRCPNCTEYRTLARSGAGQLDDAYFFGNKCS